MNERHRFIRDYRSGLYSMTELCRRFRISRKTGYKWVGRFEEEGAEGLEERSRAPKHCPHRMDERVARAIVEARRGHPTWGPKKLVAWLAARDPSLRLPAPSSAGALLAREGLVAPRKRRRGRPSEHPGPPRFPAEEANDLWTADYKGEFRMGDRWYCYPLTIADQVSRYLLGIQAMDTTDGYGAKQVFTRVFQEAGLPRAIQTDNGSPFASRGMLGLTDLSVWWIELGILPVRIQPRHPEQNGAHERMHRTLKAETASPPAGNRSAQQRRFNRFRREYNDERPHEALGQQPPAKHWRPSRRKLPASIPPPPYPDHFETRVVSGNGAFFFLHPKPTFISTCLAGKCLGFEETEHGIWSVYYYNVLLGRLNEEERTIYA
ncbi:MAG: IS481 family transposase [Myxococcota bacterium]